MKSFSIKHKDKELTLDQPKIMGILNVTPDSFCVASRCKNIDEALYKAEHMLKNGADILDVGGESTSKMVKKFGYTKDDSKFVGGKLANNQEDSATTNQELERVVPVIEALNKRFDCMISVDTSRPEVMQAAADVGASIINDVRALEKPGAIAVVKQLAIPVILMHSLVEHPPADFIPQYEDVIATVINYLYNRVQVCLRAGIAANNIIVDPGVGGGLFGKQPKHDHNIIKNLDKFLGLNYPVLLGASRKSLIGSVVNKPAEDRLAGSLAVALMAFQSGINILRVHDVAATADVLKLWQTISNS